jgi:hypothetical protein
MPVQPVGFRICLSLVQRLPVVAIVATVVPCVIGLKAESLWQPARPLASSQVWSSTGPSSMVSIGVARRESSTSTGVAYRRAGEDDASGSMLVSGERFDAQSAHSPIV